MSKPKIPSQKKIYADLGKKTNKEVSKGVGDAEAKMANKSALIANRVGAEAGEKFKFADFPQCKAEVDEMFNDFVSEMSQFISVKQSEMFGMSNAAQDKIEGITAKYYASDYTPKSSYVIPKHYSTNEDVLQAFKNRVDSGGFNISKRLWKLTPEYKKAIEDSISVALKKGQGPVALAHKVVKYLLNYDSLNAAFRKQFGTARSAKNCHYAAYRLAHTEINMAYRVAEQERWKQMDDIVGYFIKTHPTKHNVADICDHLTGKYPKSFKWLGWHPMCFCYAVPIFRSQAEHDAAVSGESVVTDVPSNFTGWVDKNAERILNASNKGTLPYFLRDNPNTWQEAVNDIEQQKKLEIIRKVLRGANAF